MLNSIALALGFVPKSLLDTAQQTIRMQSSALTVQEERANGLYRERQALLQDLDTTRNERDSAIRKVRELEGKVSQLEASLQDSVLGKNTTSPAVKKPAAKKASPAALAESPAAISRPSRRPAKKSLAAVTNPWK